MTSHQLAIVFLSIVAVMPLIGVVVGLIRSPYTIVQSLIFTIDVLLVRLLWGTSVPKQLPLPAGQGAVLVCNHRSSVDPFYLQLPAGQPIHWMVAREYCKHRLFGWFLRICMVIPVRRGGVDTSATKMAIRLAAEGGYVGMFPEGRINMKEELLLPARPGAAMIALKARVPILPCYIEGSPFAGTPTSPFRMPARVRVKFGEPIDLSSYYDRTRENGVLAEITRRCMAEIAKLAGQPNYQVKLAGRQWKPSQEEVKVDLAEATQRKKLRHR